MRRLLFFLLVICTCASANAQQLTVKSVNLRPHDTRARTNPRDDAKGKKCAIIRVGVVGVDNLVFPDAVGEVKHILSEYVVYVPDGLKSFKYNNKSGQNIGSIDFDDYGLEINSLASYDVIFESGSNLRSAIFSIKPKHARLVFNGEKVDVDKDGLAMVNKPIGEYSYLITADGFEEQSGTVALKEDDISTVTDVVLEEVLYPVKINVFPEKATVFVDNVPYTKETWSDLKLSGGKHLFRITASNYDEEEKSIVIKRDMSPLFFTLDYSKLEVVEHKEEMTRTNISIRNAIYITANFSMMGIKDPSALFKSKNALDFAGELSFVQHFAGLLAIREGISVSVLKPNRNEYYFEKAIYNDSTRLMLKFDIPLQIGFSLPFGAYNRHLLTIFGGAYGSSISLQEWKESALKDEEKNYPSVDENAYYWDYGIRLSFKLDIGHFTLGADLSQSLNKMGGAAGINIGCKLYSLKKKRK